MIFSCKKKKNGFGIIEILITLGVLSVGILGIIILQSLIVTQSQDNKRTNEAFSIAQSRIEEMRNYTSRASNTTEFDALYPNTSGFQNNTAILGVSAAFTRTESITTVTDVKNLAVNVAWNSPDGISRSVRLSTKLSFISPRSVGDAALVPSKSLIEAPM